MNPASVSLVMAASLAAVLVTSFAAFVQGGSRDGARRVAGHAGSIASGLMLAASYVLLEESLRFETAFAIAGFVAGAAFSYGLQLMSGLADDGAHRAAGEIGTLCDRRPVLLHGLHAAVEGVAIGAAMAYAMPLGLYVVATLALHNIAEGIVLARALAQQAPVLLLDEPTSALDIGHQQQALELVTALRQQDGLTVISALHDLTLAATYTDRLTMLHHGAVVAAGAATDVLTPERLGEVYNVSVTVDVDVDATTGEETVIVVPRRGPH